MKRMIGGLAMGALILTLGACSSSNNASTTTTAAPTTASGGGSTTAKTDDTKATSGTTKTPGTAKTSVTKPTKIEKVDKSKLPAKAQTADQGLSGLTSDQQDCIDTAIYTTISNDPSLADEEARLAGVIGGSIVACVPQDLIATGITKGITDSSGGASITSEQAACIQNTLATADSSDIALLIGGTIISDPTIVRGAASALDQACGTKLAG